MKTKKGFTLLEIMMVCSILGLLAVLSFVGYHQAYKQVLARCIGQDLRRAAEAIKYYICDNNELPKNNGKYHIQPELLPYFPKGWPSTSKLGQKWSYTFWPEMNGSYFIIDMNGSFEGSQVLRDAVELCDQQIDDGHHSTGRMRLGSQNRLWYVVENGGWNPM